MLLHENDRAPARGVDERASCARRTHAPAEAVILAAGAGSRIRTRAGDPPKPLTLLMGRPLLEHSVRAFLRAGVRRLTVVVGFQGAAVAGAVRTLAARYGVQAVCVENTLWEEGNGTSVLAAARVVDGPFYLAMGDHLFSPGILRALDDHDAAAPLSLAVDEGWRATPDLEEATKVRREGHLIADIGKAIHGFDAVDTGIFRCRPSLFGSLERSRDEGDASLTGAVRILARRRAAVAVPVTGMFWQDVDTPADLALAARRIEALRARDRDTLAGVRPVA